MQYQYRMVKLVKYHVPTKLFILKDSVHPSVRITATESDLFFIDNAFFNIAYHSRGIVPEINVKSRILALYPMTVKGRRGRNKEVWTTVMYPGTCTLI